MANELSPFHSVDAIVFCDDAHSGGQHLSLRRDACGQFALQLIHYSFQSPDDVESTVIQANAS